MNFTLSTLLIAIGFLSACTHFDKSASSSSPRTIGGLIKENQDFQNKKRKPASMREIYGVEFDGCYQTFKPGSMDISFCLFGTAEEGIGGSNVRWYIFHTNTNDMQLCARASKTGVDNGTYFLEVKGVRELVMSEIEIRGGRPYQGKVSFDGAGGTLDFIHIPHSGPLIESIKAKESECSPVEVGGYKAF